MAKLWNLGTDPDLAPNREIAMPGETIPAMFWNAVEQRGETTWLRQKDLGIWRSWTWQQTAVAVREIAGGLLSLGFAKGECASILANTLVEWVWADLAVLSAAGVANGIYPTDAASQVQYLCEDSKTTVLFVEDDEQLDKALEARNQLPLLRKIVVFDMEGLSSLQDPGVISLDGLRTLGRLSDQTPRCTEAARCSSSTTGFGHFGLHLGHHRQTQRCHAQPCWFGVHCARVQHLGVANRGG
jgi:long-chain acyl-CoA synthetase